MRPGAEFFTEPSGSAQRRYEAMRAYFVDRYVESEAASSGRLIFSGFFAESPSQTGGPGKICSSGGSAAPQAR